MSTMGQESYSNKSDYSLVISFQFIIVIFKARFNLDGKYDELCLLLIVSCLSFS